MSKRVYSRHVNMVCGYAIVIEGDIVMRIGFEVPEVIAKDYDVLAGYLNVVGGRIIRVDVHHNYIIEAVMDENNSILSLGIVKGRRKE